MLEGLSTCLSGMVISSKRQARGGKSGTRLVLSDMDDRSAGFVDWRPMQLEETLRDKAVDDMGYSCLISVAGVIYLSRVL